MGHHMAAARTGVFRVAEHVAAGLSRHEDVALSLCAGARLLSGDTTINPMCEAYLRESGNLRGVPFYAEHLPGFDLYHSPYHPLPSHIQQPRFLMIHDMIAVKFPHFLLHPRCGMPTGCWPVSAHRTFSLPIQRLPGGTFAKSLIFWLSRSLLPILPPHPTCFFLAAIWLVWRQYVQNTGWETTRTSSRCAHSSRGKTWSR